MNYKTQKAICCLSISLLLLSSGYYKVAAAAQQENSISERIIPALFIGGFGYLISWALYSESQRPAENLLTIDPEGLTIRRYELIRWSDIRTASLLKERENGQTQEFIVLELTHDSPRTSCQDEALSKRLGLRNYEMFISKDDVNGATNLRNLKRTLDNILIDKNREEIRKTSYFAPVPKPAAAYLVGGITTLVVLACLFGKVSSTPGKTKDHHNTTSKTGKNNKKNKKQNKNEDNEDDD